MSDDNNNLEAIPFAELHGVRNQLIALDRELQLGRPIHLAEMTGVFRLVVASLNDMHARLVAIEARYPPVPTDGPALAGDDLQPEPPKPPPPKPIALPKP